MKNRFKVRVFLLVCIGTLFLVQGTSILAGVLRAAAYQGETSTKNTTYSGCQLVASASCYGKVASGYVNASAIGSSDNLSNVDGATYEFFDMDGYHEYGTFSMLYGRFSDFWESSNWFSDKSVAYSSITY